MRRKVKQPCATARRAATRTVGHDKTRTREQRNEVGEADVTRPGRRAQPRYGTHQADGSPRPSGWPTRCCQRRSDSPTSPVASSSLPPLLSRMNTPPSSRRWEGSTFPPPLHPNTPLRSAAPTQLRCGRATHSSSLDTAGPFSATGEDGADMRGGRGGQGDEAEAVDVDSRQAGQLVLSSVAVAVVAVVLSWSMGIECWESETMTGVVDAYGGK